MDAGHPVKIEANQSLTLADGEFCGLYEIRSSLDVEIELLNTKIAAQRNEGRSELLKCYN